MYDAGKRLQRKRFIMPTALLNLLIVLTPIVVLFSGMAMTPMLGLISLLVLLSSERSALAVPGKWFAQYRVVLALLGTLLLWALATDLWSILPERSVSVALRVAGMCLLGMLAFVYAPALKRPSPAVWRNCAYSVVLVSLLVLLEKLPGGGPVKHIYLTEGKDYERFIDKNINRGLCALSVFIWPVLLGLLQQHRVRLAWMTVGILALAIFSMHSLSAKVGLMAGVMIWGAVRMFPRAVPQATIVLLPLFLLSFPFLYQIAEPTVFANPTVQSHLTPSGFARLHIWHELLEKVRERPLTGWGMDTTRAMPLSESALTAMDLKAPPLHPHSPSLQLLLELGGIGLVFTAVMIGIFLRLWEQATRNQPRLRTTSAAFIAAYFVSGVSSFGIWQSWWIATLWIAAFFWRYAATPPSETAVFT